LSEKILDDDLEQAETIERNRIETSDAATHRRSSGDRQRDQQAARCRHLHRIVDGI
jgi:hypothetical protein